MRFIAPNKRETDKTLYHKTGMDKPGFDEPDNVGAIHELPDTQFTRIARTGNTNQRRGNS